MKKSALYLLTALLSLFCVQTSMAQAVQDAFYVYRNDGSFNGFFFADIDHIEYSKVDTFGVEQDKYVVQEVYTRDSLIRIPISAIDSVAFVTPETKYKSDVKFTTGNEIWNYVIASDSIRTLLLDPNTPASLVPQAGDKMVTIDSYPLLPGGFYGKVLAVSDVGVGFIVNCEIPELTELFERHVVKVSAIGEDASQTRTRRDENSAVIDFDLPGKRVDMSLTDAGYKLNDKFSITGEGNLSYGFAPWAHVRAFVAVDSWTGVNVDATMRVETTTWFDLGIKGGISGQFDIEWVKHKKWIPKTPFFIEQGGGFSSSCSGETELKIHRKNVSTITSIIQYNENLFDDLPQMYNAGFHNLGTESKTEVTGKVTITAGPYYSVALTLIDRKITGIGMRFDAGAKLEVEAEVKWDDLVLTSPALLAGDLLLNPTAQYDLLDRDGSVKIGPFVTGKVTFEVANKWTKDFKFLDLATPWSFEGGLVPHFSDVEVRFDDETHAPVPMAFLSRPTLFSCPIGFARYYTKSSRRVGETKWADFEYWKEEPAGYSYMLTPTGGGLQVTLFPTTRLLGYELLASPYVTYTQPAFIEVDPKLIDIDEKDHTQRITVKDNLDRNEENYQREVKIDFDEDEEPWISGAWEGNDYVATIKANHTGKDRQKNILIEEYNEDKSVSLSATVQVNQKSDELQNLIVEPHTVTLPGYNKEFKDGQLAATVTVKYLKTSLGIRAIPSDEPWFRVDPDWASTTTDDLYNICTCKFYVTPNTSFSNSRQATIDFEVINADNSLTTQQLTVKQEPMEATLELMPNELLLSADSPDDPSYSDVKVVTIVSNLLEPDFIQYVKDQKAVANVDWIETDIQDGTLMVKAQANQSEEPRDGSLNYSITTTSGEEKTASVRITQQGKVYVPPFTIAPEIVRFNMGGGDITVSILGDYVDHIKEINCYNSIWLGGGGMGKSFTLTAKANPNSGERSATYSITVQMTDGTLQTQQFIAYQNGTADAPQPVGDSPFKRINFMVQAMVESVSEDADTIATAYFGFNFEDSNSSMTLTEYKEYNHYECQGYLESALRGQQGATLSFDITKKDHLVKNLRFTGDGTTKQDMIFPGMGTIHMTFHSVSSMSFNDIPLTSNSRTYQETNVSVAEGLKFTSFSSGTDTDATYDINSTFDPDQTGIPPAHQHTTVYLIDNPGNYVRLAIEYKKEEPSDVTLEWPDDAVMTGLKSGGMPVYEGSTPPTVNGTYVLSPITVAADPTDSKGELDGTEKMVIKLSDQKDGEITFNSYYVADGESSGAGDEMKGLIIGGDDKFSICVPDGEGMAFILTGRIENGTVTDLHLASTSMEEAGQYIILKDGDGESQTTQWSPAPSED